MANGQTGIKICTGKKTLEYQICKANVYEEINATKGTWLYELIQRENAAGIDKVNAYLTTIGDDVMSEEQQQNVALLMWKCLPGKAEFAQTLNAFLLEKMEAENEVKFAIPLYILNAINHLIP